MTTITVNVSKELSGWSVKERLPQAVVMTQQNTDVVESALHNYIM